MKTTALATGLLLGLLPTLTHAIETDIFGGPSGFNIARGDDFGTGASDILSTAYGEVLSWLLYFATAAAVIMIIYSGIQLIQSGGDSEKAQTAKRSIIYIVVGIVLLMCVFLIINISGGLANFLAGAQTTF
ncbi:MAG: hypothetical protein Q7R60_00035 [bacterium]|nr:hypothetical protein [bacterium]